MSKFDKNSQKFTLVNRRAHDPRAYDETPSGIFVEQQHLNSASRKLAIKNEKQNLTRAIGRQHLENLHDEFAAQGRRENEGEAALYGITFDDSKYDYMQHLQPIGTHQGAIFVSADGKQRNSYIPAEAAGRMTLTDLLNDGDKPLDEPTFHEHIQAQLPIQDALAGLQPDMDPRLREVLEALEDEEYVELGEEDDDEDLFAELIATGEVKDPQAWKQTEEPQVLEQRQDEEDWEFTFRKFKVTKDRDGDIESDFGGVSDVDSDVGSEYANVNEDPHEVERDAVGELPKVKPGRRKIGAKTDLSGYSMSSSANYRNEGLTLLDDKFDKIEEEYAMPEHEEAEEFDMANERKDLESIMDEFLEDFVVEGKHLYKRTK